MFTIKLAAPEDAETLLSLIDALADYEQLERPNEAARTRLIADAFPETDPQRNGRTMPRFFAYLLQEGEKAVGYTIVLETDSSFLAKPTLYIEDLFVLPEVRNRGGGHALFEFLAAEALRRNCGRMEWVCLNWNERAIRFYEKRGAEHLAEWRVYRLTEENLRKLVRNEP